MTEPCPLYFFLTSCDYASPQEFLDVPRDPAKQRPSEVAQLIDSLTFPSLQIWRYLSTTRVPREMLQSLFDTVLHTPGAIPTNPQWLQICIALTPPFRSLDPHRILDIRPENKRHTKGWVEYEGRTKLIADLAEPCLTYEHYIMQQYRQRRMEKNQRERTLSDLKIAEYDFRIWRERGSLPEALKRERSAHVTYIFTEARRILENLPPDRIVDITTDKARLSGQYNRLLDTMYTAFNTHMPRPDYPHYPNGAKHAALSAILSTILYPGVLPHPNSTTPYAIQRRLRNRKPA